MTGTLPAVGASISEGVQIMQNIFLPADILLPDFEKTHAYKWSVIACDQFTGDPDYWEKTAQIVGDAPSTLKLILPEVYLEETNVLDRIHAIHHTMQQYLSDGLFRCYENAMIYTERMQANGILRAGVIGKIDLIPPCVRQKRPYSNASRPASVCGCRHRLSCPTS